MSTNIYEFNGIDYEMDMSIKSEKHRDAKWDSPAEGGFTVHIEYAKEIDTGKVLDREEMDDLADSIQEQMENEYIEDGY